MKQQSFLFRNSVFFFIIFFALVLWAFWINYYGRLTESMPFHTHFHGIVMTLWCIMLISQATLIRFKQYKWHKISGKFSFILVPLIIISGFHIAHVSIGEQPSGTDIFYYRIALMFNSIVAFTILYGLAIYFRSIPQVHARFMIGTVFPVMTPATDRIIHIFFPVMRDFVPTVNGSPMVQIYGFLLASLVLLAMIAWDWKQNTRPWAFISVLIVVLLYQISVLFFYNFSFWQRTGDWIMSLPLS